MERSLKYMQLVIQFDPTGQGKCLFTEAVPLHEIGSLDVTRASTVEFSPRWQHWEVKIPGDPITVLYADSSRDACINWEIEHFNAMLAAS